MQLSFASPTACGPCGPRSHRRQPHQSSTLPLQQSYSAQPCSYCLQQHSSPIHGSTERHRVRVPAAVHRASQTPPDEDEAEVAGPTPHSNNSGLTAAEMEALDVLEWPAVSMQVARLCDTVMASQRLASGGLPLGTSLAHSEQLQAETAEAVELNLRVGSIYDLTPALVAVQGGACLNAKQLEGVAVALEAALTIKAAVEVQGPEGPRYPALSQLSKGISADEHTLLKAIRHCIRLGGVADEASEALAAVRVERRDNADALRTLMNDIMRKLFERGASDSRSVTLIRDRYCAGIKAGRQSELPKGSVKLGSSQTGATMYYEPAPAIPLNNKAALLAAEEKQEENKVLALLSQMLASRAEAVRQLLEAVTQLDIVAARARHAVLFQAVPPRLVPATAHTAALLHQTRSTTYFHVPAAHHPLLLERALDAPLPDAPSVEENTFERDFAPPPAWERRASSSSPAPAQRPPAPRALDLRVPGGHPVVAVTGPNTGGKTVTLKTLGLVALMARAGLWLPVENKAEDRAPVTVGWFGRVLADIGDAQSLQQNLSTFSGHITRIKQILATADAGSLVLLDEVGSGTDPVEGAALARAILDRLAGVTALTVATTHHAELKHVAAEDPRYCNVSMEFDTISLRPTYRLLWGAVGASNALSIARTLGFDSAIVKDAEIVARTTFEAQADRAARLAATAASLQTQLEDTRAEVEDMRQRRTVSESRLDALKDKIKQLQDTKAALEASPRRIVARRDKLRSALETAIAAYEAGTGTREDVDRLLEDLEKQVPHKVAQHQDPHSSVLLAQAELSKGDKVVVPSRHGEDTVFTVTAVNGSTAVLVPEGAMGVALQLFTMGSGGGKRKAAPSAIKVPVSECRVVVRV